MVNKGSSFADFVRFRPYTYARTQQSLPPLWAAIIDNLCRPKDKYKKITTNEIISMIYSKNINKMPKQMTIKYFLVHFKN